MKKFISKSVHRNFNEPFTTRKLIVNIIISNNSENTNNVNVLWIFSLNAVCFVYYFVFWPKYHPLVERVFLSIIYVLHQKYEIKTQGIYDVINMYSRMDRFLCVTKEGVKRFFLIYLLSYLFKVFDIKNISSDSFDVPRFQKLHSLLSK